MLLQNYLEQNAQQYPDKQAVSFNQDSISYGELNARSNNLAHLLVDQTKGEKRNVGLYFGKSVASISAIFAVLKSGCAYVPLDSDSPLERCGYIISDCAIDVLISDAMNVSKLIENAELLPSHLNIILLSGNIKDYLDDLPKNWNLFKEAEISDISVRENLPASNESSDLAYILYTSGSTGKPKGVMISHRNSMAFVDWCNDYFHFSHEDVFSSHAPFHFDLSILDIFCCVKAGGHLCLLPPGLAYFGDAMADYVERNKITVWYSVPLALNNMLAVGEALKRKLKSIRCLIYAGEVFNYLKLNELLKYLPGCSVYNLYGPTETNVITSFELKVDDTIKLSGNLPIGKPTPFANTRIIDEKGNEVEVGEVGELVVNGDSLMRGYWNDPDKTSEKISALNDGDSVEYFYFTGDLVKQLPDGNMSYVNRKDNMIKTRGFRVELGEIDAALLSCPTIKNAVTVATPDETLGHRITAFIQPETQHPINEEDIETHLLQIIPTYMLPQQIIFLDELPKNSRGKLDRVALQVVSKTLKR